MWPSIGVQAAYQQPCPQRRVSFLHPSAAVICCSSNRGGLSLWVMSAAALSCLEAFGSSSPRPLAPSLPPPIRSWALGVGRWIQMTHKSWVILSIVTRNESASAFTAKRSLSDWSWEQYRSVGVNKYLTAWPFSKTSVGSQQDLKLP